MMSDSSFDSSSSSEDEMDPSENVNTAEDNVNRRVGHIGVAYEGGALVWAGYAEVPPFLEGHEYWPPGDVWHFSFYHNVWRKLTTKGDTPNRCSGAGGCILEDTLFIVAGFHQVFRTYNRDSSESSDDDDQPPRYPRIEISNRIWSLNLRSLVWKKLTPGGIPPLACDKTSLWPYQDKVFLFGGFGTPHTQQSHGAVSRKFQFVEDEPFPGISRRGWSNQLVYYNSEKNRWVWPNFSGTPPSPRAAHSAAIISDKVYIFGGRHSENRLNDLHCLDLVSMTWTSLLLPSDSPPVGRSWQSLTPIYTGKPPGGLLLYGGFDKNMTALSDCWRMDFANEELSWVRQKQFEDGARLWHTAVPINQSTVIIVGGLTNNIQAPEYVTKHHAEKVLFLRVAPPSLLSLSLEFISNHQTLFKQHFRELPFNLRSILEIRASGGA
ncbi:kelch domain-containing protein 2 [Eurytemora carolleeae]|uniref:kelch domain-containing protein 2 n=1 Tax=Eurytemora carolleeae TaxID=1294199 RepID=UPI000C7623E5|nr:kelch domain-containing protein 2 [Eurytemora carolleeae]XP_023346002.1 kelch domain-containing protein 2 [Eurytemora carolleeae]XP_023346003.1 kelch domain-containing protein 2 [Eurytemora carolleeae]|eukprot:XP_023346001.1 kelch domain-containing protein 2-like [Eurytemora affinis]